MRAFQAPPGALAIGSLIWALGFGSAAGAVGIDFDNLTGRGGPFFGECESQFRVDDEYDGLGVTFESNDTAVCVIAPGNAVSPPNVVTGITAGDIDFSAPVIAKFFDGVDPGAVALVTLHLTSGSLADVEALDENGVLLGDSGKTGEGVHTLAFPKLIHEVRVSNGTFAFDEFSFSPIGPPAAVPALGSGAWLGLALLLVGVWSLRPVLQH